MSQVDRAPEVAPDPASPPKLLDQVRARIRAKHYSIRTDDNYVKSINHYIYFPRQTPRARIWHGRSECVADQR